MTPLFCVMAPPEFRKTLLLWKYRRHGRDRQCHQCDLHGGMQMKSRG
jgi:hypothetical protein